ncbi:ATP-binding cassette domain-containing protein, partial [Streptomyces lunaelactis]
MEFNGMARRLDPARTYVLGRDPQSDMEFQEAVVSWRHARIYWNGKSWVLQDLGSTNGTYTNGRCMRLADITHGAVSSLGSEADGPQLRFNAPTHQQNGHVKGGVAPPEAHRDSQPTAPRSHGQAVRVATLTARRLTVKVKCGKSKRTLLNKVSFAVPPKALIAVIGPSGSGKSTLLRALTGHQRDVRGEVLYENQNLHERFAELRQRIGIVPQHD